MVAVRVDESTGSGRSRAALLSALFLKELREMLVGRALWTTLALVSPLVGFSFATAVVLYAEASQSMARFPELSRNLVPLTGVVTPTFGALYLMNTFLLPFLAIRFIGNEKQSGSLKLILQLPLKATTIVVLKSGALAIGWLLATVPVLSALAIWLLLGGHLHPPELAAVFLGHAVYGLVIAAVAFLAAALTESTATAAIVALAFTLASWILEFAGTTQSGWVRELAAFTLSASLRTLERGLIASPQILIPITVALVLLGLTAVWLPTGAARGHKVRWTGATLVLATLAIALWLRFPLYADVSEDRRNSLNPAEERALRQLPGGLNITLYLAPGDSRLADLDRNLLSKLRRSVPNLSIVLAETGKVGVFGAATSDRYGLAVYQYGGQEVESRATNSSEILELIFGLAGVTVTPEAVQEYRGYPLVTSASPAIPWFVGVLPALCLLGWWRAQRVPGRSMRLFSSGSPSTESRLAGSRSEVYE